MSYKMIWVKKSIYDKPIENDDKKVDIKLYLPPTDVPDNVKADFDASTESFIITFQYTVNETGKILFDNPEASMEVGKKTGKPLVIRVKNILSEKITQIELTKIIQTKVENQIIENYSKVSDLRQKGNLEKTKDFLNQQVGELVSAAA